MVEKNKVLTTDHIRGSPEFAPIMVQRMIDGQTNVKYQQQQQAADEETQATEGVPMEATLAEPTSGSKPTEQKSATWKLTPESSNEQARAESQQKTPFINTVGL